MHPHIHKNTQTQTPPSMGTPDLLALQLSREGASLKRYEKLLMINEGTSRGASVLTGFVTFLSTKRRCHGANSGRKCSCCLRTSSHPPSKPAPAGRPLGEADFAVAAGFQAAAAAQREDQRCSAPAGAGGLLIHQFHWVGVGQKQGIRTLTARRARAPPQPR